ncbi:UD11 glucuronosyltransferase, partial [Rhinopomastus cyanomelas]|nr:UD11 glucuronosyltransferase [Rhinopomastus cyanomelas]
LVVLLCLLRVAAGGKLLVVPSDGSPWLSMREILDILKQKGHEIVVVASETRLQIKRTEHYVMKIYPVPFTQEEMDEKFNAFLQEMLKEGSFLERYQKLQRSIGMVTELAVRSCEHLLYNKELMKYLEESKFDAVFTDPVVPCGQIVAEHLSLPSVFFSRGVPCGIDFEATQCPNPPSYVPRGFTPHSDRMDFLERVKNTLFDLSNLFLCDVFYGPYEELASRFLQRDVTMTDLARKGSVWLMRLDFVLDYPRPLMPNMVFIGGVHCTHKKLAQ